MNERYLVVIWFKDLPSLLEALLKVIHKYRQEIRSIYLGPADREGTRYAAVEVDAERASAEELLWVASTARGFVKARVEEFPAILFRDTTYPYDVMERG